MSVTSIEPITDVNVREGTVVSALAAEAFGMAVAV
jgi:hypothetical protein